MLSLQHINNNVTIPDNTIIEANSNVVSKTFKEEYTAITGNPAKIIKQIIYWKPTFDNIDS